MVVSTPINLLLLIALVGTVLTKSYSDSVSMGSRFVSLPANKKWALGGLAAYTIASLFATCRVKYFWPKHAIFVIPAMTYIASILVSSA